jgi:2-oxoglutarate/2-oxoacid ferredoxin oxidoreductase subunit alpha
MMEPLEVANSTMGLQPRRPVINDFCITFSTVNGSGSATANTTMLRALFRMGIPVSGKNIFPSNIQGLPTWYTIRISKDGYLARLEKDDIIVAMNPATFAKEQEYILPGGAFFYSDDIKAPIIRNDIHVYPMPVKQIIRNADVPPKLKDYVANMVYVGIVSQVIGVELEKIEMALDYHFKGKKNAVQSNFSVVSAAYQWAAENIEKKDAYRVEPMNATDGYIMADGMPRLHWDQFLVECNLLPGIQLPLRLLWLNHSQNFYRFSAKIPRQERTPMPSSRQRMNWPRSG